MVNPDARILLGSKHKGILRDALDETHWIKVDESWLHTDDWELAKKVADLLNPETPSDIKKGWY